MKTDFARCPHCDKPGIPIGQRRSYSRGWPAVCRACGGFSYDRSLGSVIGLAFLSELLVPLLLIGVLSLPGLLRAVAIGCAAGFLIYRWRPGRKRPPNPPFHPVSPERSRRARQFTYGFTFVFVAAVIGYSWMVFVHHR